MAFGPADTAKLIVDLSLKGNFVAQLGKVNGALDKTAAKLDRTQSTAYRRGQQIGTGIKSAAVIAAGAVGFLATQVAFGVNSLIQLKDATAQTNAALKSTKGAAGQTADSIRALAEKYESLNATIDDKVIQSGENVLLTFTNIRKQAFEPALQAALDLSVAMHQDLQTSIVQVGKALNNPIKGLTALQRIGVSFSKDQEKLIKHFIATNKVEEAQKIILAELNREFGGSFLAGGQTTAGKIAKVGDAIEGLQQALARALLPAIGNVADALTTLFNDPQIIASADQLGQDIAKIFSKDNINKGIAFLKNTVLPFLKTTFQVVQGIAEKAIALWNKIPAPLQKALIAGVVVNKLTGGLITGGGGGDSGLLGDIVKGISTGVASGVAGGLVRAGIGSAAGSAAGGAAGAVAAGGLVAVLGVGVAAAIGTAVAVAFKAHFQDPAFHEQTNAINKGVQAQVQFYRPLNELLQTQAALQKGIDDLTVVDKNGNPVPILNDIAGLLYGGQKDDLQNQLKIVNAAVAAAILASRKPYGNGKPLGGRKSGFTASFVETNRGAMADRLAAEEVKKGVKDAGVAGKQDIESLRGKISEGLKPLATAKDVESVRGSLANQVNPSVIGVGGDVEAARGGIIAAIDNKDLSIDQKINIDVNVSAAGVTKSVTIQNRYGPGNGSSGRDLGGPNGSGGGVNSGAG